MTEEQILQRLAELRDRLPAHVTIEDLIEKAMAKEQGMQGSDWRQRKLNKPNETDQKGINHDAEKEQGKSGKSDGGSTYHGD